MTHEQKKAIHKAQKNQAIKDAEDEEEFDEHYAFEMEWWLWK